MVSDFCFINLSFNKYFPSFSTSATVSMYSNYNVLVLQVDTVNDSHMVASGVPEKNGDRHASIVASMALDVLVRPWLY